MLSGTTFAQPEVAVKNCDEFYKKCIPLDNKLTAQAVEVVEQFVKKALISKMKELDGLFNVLYSRIYHGGSYYDGLRITEPTEFDLNAVLQMPFRKNVMKLKYGNGKSIPFGFAEYYCISSPEKVTTSPKMTENLKKFFLDFFEENTFVLLPLKVRDWFRSVVDKAIRYYERNPFEYCQKKLTVRKFKWTPLSPAATLKIKVDNDLEVDIDLVPVFVNEENEDEMLVSKTYRHEDYQKVWRLSYPSVERNQLKGESCAMKVIRLLKWLRDNFKDWDWVSSYYLKTVVMLEKERDGSKWSDKQLAEKLEEMLKCLHEYFKNGEIPSVHDCRLNLLHHIKPITLSNAERRLKRFIETNGEIHDKFMGVFNKSSKLKSNRTFAALTALTVQGKVCFENEVGIEWMSNAEVEDLLEKAFPYEHKENEINVNNSDYNWCTLV